MPSKKQAKILSKNLGKIQKMLTLFKAPDAGIDVEIRYNNVLWKTPMDFLKDFKPVLEKYCQQRD